MKSFITMLLMVFLSFVFIASASAQNDAGIKGTTEFVKIEWTEDAVPLNLYDMAFINIGKIYESYTMLSGLNSDYPVNISGMEKTGGNVFACSKHNSNDNLLNKIALNRPVIFLMRC